MPPEKLGLGLQEQTHRRKKINKRELELVPEQQALEQFLKRADNGFDFFKAEIVRNVWDKGFAENIIEQLQSQPRDEGGKRDGEIDDYTIMLKILKQNDEVHRRNPLVNSIYVQAEGILDNYHTEVKRTGDYSNEADSRSAALSLLLAHINQLEDNAK